MKTIRIAICAVALAGFSMSTLANTYSWVDANGQKFYSDRAPIGMIYSVKYHAPPSPSTPPTVPPSISAPMLAAYSGDPRMLNAYAADASSAIKERQRGQARECLSIQQNISRISSSRNFTVDQETGRSLEERQIREAQELYNAVCNA